MAIALIASTESGDLYSVEYAAGTSTVDLTPTVAGRKVSIRGGTLLVSAACEIQLVEETSGTALSGKFDLPQAAEWSIEFNREYAAQTDGKKIQLTRSASAKITGEVLVSS